MEVDTYTLAGRDGDVFLICSDGLTSMISDDEVASILRSAASPRRGRRGARPRREPERRQGQHHGDPVPPRRGRAGRGARTRSRRRPRTTRRSPATSTPTTSRPRRWHGGRRTRDAADATVIHRRRGAARAGRSGAAAPARRRRRGRVRAARRARAGRCSAAVIGGGSTWRSRAGLLHRHQRRRPRDRLPRHPVRAAVRASTSTSRSTRAAMPARRDPGGAPRRACSTTSGAAASDAVDLVRALERGQLDAGPRTDVRAHARAVRPDPGVAARGGRASPPCSSTRCADVSERDAHLRRRSSSACA